MLAENRLLKLVADCQLSETLPIVVGVSGGADSLCLLAVLHRLGFPLIVAHFNHRLREEAQNDEASVAAAAEKFGLPFVAGRGSVREYAVLHHESIEEAARNLRYRFLFETAQSRGAQAVAVGHTADDLVETVLMHLLRGAGLAGLGGMLPRLINPAWSETIPVVRPLLTLWHADTLALCASEGLVPVTDQTNLDVTYHRNRLRLELIPLLERYNPQLRETIWRTALTLRDDFTLIDQAAEEAWQALILIDGASGVVLRRPGYLAAPAAIQRQLLRKAIESLRSLRDIDLDTVERARAFIQAPSRSRRMDLAVRLTLSVDADRIFLIPWGARLPGVAGPGVSSSQPVELPVPGKIELQDGWWIEAGIGSALGVDSAGDPAEAYLDLDCLTLPLRVRSRRAGDRWQPYGLIQGTQKLSDYFVNEKIEASLRKDWPLVCSGEEIVWVAGCRIGHPFRVTPGSKQVLRLRLGRRELS